MGDPNIILGYTFEDARAYQRASFLKPADTILASTNYQGRGLDGVKFNAVFVTERAPGGKHFDAILERLRRTARKYGRELNISPRRYQ